MSNRFKHKRRNLVVRLFKGDVSLPITYWVFGVLIYGVVLGALLNIVELIYPYTDDSGALLARTFYWLVIACTIFMFIAIWRSAGKYRGNAIWKWLARIMVVVGVVFFGANQQTSTDYALLEDLRLMKQKLPTMLDKHTRLNQVFMSSGDIYHYYTLVNWSAKTLDIQRFTTVMNARHKTFACKEEDTRSLLNEGRTFVHIYRDRHNKPVSLITVTSADCL